MWAHTESNRQRIYLVKMAYCSGDPLPLCALEKKPYPHGQDSDNNV